MAGTKVSELAKELGYSNKEMMEILSTLNIPAKSHASALVDAYVDIVRENVTPREVGAEPVAPAAEAAPVVVEMTEEEAAHEAARLAAEQRRQERLAKQAEREAAKAAQVAAAAPAAVAPAAAAPVPAVTEMAPAAVTAEPVVVAEAVAEDVPAPVAAEETPASEQAPDVAPAPVTAKVAVAEPTVVEETPAVLAAVDEIPAAEVEKSSAAATPAVPVVAEATVEPAAPVVEATAPAAEPTVPAEPTMATATTLEERLAIAARELERTRAAEAAAAKQKAKPAKMPKGNVSIPSGDGALRDEYAAMADAVGVSFDRAEALKSISRDVAAHKAESAKRPKKGKKGAEEVSDDRQHAATAASGELSHGGGLVKITEGSTVQQFADALKVAPQSIIKSLFMLGQVATLTQSLSNEQMELIALEMEREIKITTIAEEMSWEFTDVDEDLVSRSPVVTVMGHVDHGKTSLLDAIRETGVAATEAGGITQHIGASVVHKNGREITFIDTPGHEAFTAMRARGANITDIVILVVAADDGVMPQTIEAIAHAKAAGVPIVVAVNKIDKEGANPDRVRQMLTEYEIVPEDWGGKNIFVNVSAKKRTGIDELLEMLLLQADMLELRANPNAPGFGTVIEAKLDKGRGPVATVLVQRGTLRVGDPLVAGTAHGRVRALVAPSGVTVASAGPSEPVEVLGLSSVPSAGDEFLAYAEEREAKAEAERRATRQRIREQEKSRRHISLDDLFSSIESGEIRELNLVVKADVQGSIEALSDALDKMDQSEVRINVIHGAVGGITETDIQLAVASNAIVVGFNVRPTPKAKAMAAEEQVDVRLYRVIYQAIEEINQARIGMLAPESVDEDTGQAEVRELFRVPKAGVIAGCYVLDGEISREDMVRVVRDGTVVFEGSISSLRRFKEDAKTVKRGYECGIGVSNFQDLKVGDIIEGYRTVEVARVE